MKPKVICHIMSSVDGRLIPSRWTAPYSTDAAPLFGEYASLGQSLKADAWMFGKGTTVEFFPVKYTPKSAVHPKAGKINVGKLESPRLFVTVDPDADILYTSDNLRGDNIVAILGANATEDYLATLEEKGISYIVLDDATDLGAAMEALHKCFGVRTISLQGGGIINGEMLRAGLIDELSVVVYPGIDGLAIAPSIFECPGSPAALPAAGQKLELTSARTFEGGLVWLRYIIHKDGDRE